MHISRPKLIASSPAVLALVALLAHASAARQPRLASRSTRSPARAGSGSRSAALGFLGGFLRAPSAPGARRSPRRAARICPRQAAARIGVGCMVNSFAPAKLGDAVKIALCARAIDGPGRIWTTGGVYAALAAARSLTLALLLVVASATGAMPIWPVFVIFGAVGLLAVAGAFSGRLRSHPRIAHVLGGLAALERSPRAIATVARLDGRHAARAARRHGRRRRGARAAAPAARGAAHPPRPRPCSLVPDHPRRLRHRQRRRRRRAREPRHRHVAGARVGLAIQALETLVSVTVGSLGALYLACAERSGSPLDAPRRHRRRIAPRSPPASASPCSTSSSGWSAR